MHASPKRTTVAAAPASAIASIGTRTPSVRSANQAGEFAVRV
jgi:hypothetical protein